MKRILLLIVLALAAKCAMAAESPAAPEDLIAKIEKQTSAFLNMLSDVKCTEFVEQSKLTPKGKTEFRANSRYDYLLMAQSTEGEMDLRESRLQEVAAVHRDNVPLLLTNGFATQVLVFHPFYRFAYEFFDGGMESANGRAARKIQFRHIRGQRTPTVLMLRNREYPLEMKGTAWVDVESGTIQRIVTDLQVDMSDIGLKSLHTDVSYAPVHFNGVTETPWLPASAEIEVATLKQHWKNVHRFEKYQHFGVETEHKDDASSLARKPE